MGRGRIGIKALRKIIELHVNTGFSNRQISEATGASRPVLAEYIDAYTRSGLTWAEFSTLTDTKAIERLMIPRETKDCHCGKACHSTENKVEDNRKPSRILKLLPRT